MPSQETHHSIGIKDKEGEEWRRLLCVYSKAKELYTKAEELEPDGFRTFVQPINELRNALDHIMRATFARFPEAQIERQEDYILSSLSKAVGHVYRCFFDIADWMSISLRKRIRCELYDGERPFSNDCIMAVWPEYYRVHRIKIDGVVQDIEIAKLREDKDVSCAQLMEEVEKYSKILNDLIDLLRIAEEHKVAMMEWTEREGDECRKSAIREWIKIVAGAVIGAILGAAATILFT